MCIHRLGVYKCMSSHALKKTFQYAFRPIVIIIFWPSVDIFAMEFKRLQVETNVGFIITTIIVYTAPAAMLARLWES